MTARVLVVDDIPANLKLLEARLSAEYFQVVTAFCGSDALDICAQQRIDVITLSLAADGRLLALEHIENAVEAT